MMSEEAKLELGSYERPAAQNRKISRATPISVPRTLPTQGARGRVGGFPARHRAYSQSRIPLGDIYWTTGLNTARWCLTRGYV